MTAISKLPTLAGILYAPPNKDGSTKNCKNCIMWVKTKQCAIHRKGLEVVADDVCGYHVYGKPMKEWMDHPGIDPVRPVHSGLELVKGGTHCLNCRHLSAVATVCTVARNADGTALASVDKNGCSARWEGASNKQKTKEPKVLKYGDKE